MPCREMVYQMHSKGSGATDMMMSDTVREDCRIAAEIVQCMKEALHTSECQRAMTPLEQAQVYMGLNFVDYICVDRIVDVIRHRACYVDTNVAEKCAITHSILTCQEESVTTCAEDVISKSNKCATGAKQFLNDIIRKGVSIVPACQGMSTRFLEFFSEFF